MAVVEQTLGYHVVISGYGLWLPGDERGTWSEAWDRKMGYIEPHMLHWGDPVRHCMAKERMRHPPVRLSPSMVDAVALTMGRCAGESDWTVSAASIEPTHTHLLITYTPRNIDKVVKWLKDQATKGIHQHTPHRGPVWCKGKWRSYIFDQQVWDNTRDYIERHNIRRGEGMRPYGFVQPS